MSNLVSPTFGAVDEPHGTYSGDERIVKVLSFPYSVERPSPHTPGATVLRRFEARRGETVKVSDLTAYDLERGERLGAFFTTEELDAWSSSGTPVTETEERPNFEEMGEGEIAAWIQEKEPTPAETVAIAGADPELALRVLEAEKQATGDDPRDEVVRGLFPIISGGAPPPSLNPGDPPTPPAPLGGTGGEPPPAGSGKVEVTEEALALAKAERVDLSNVKGTGQDGRIKKSDVQAALDARSGS